MLTCVKVAHTLQYSIFVIYVKVYCNQYSNDWTQAMNEFICKKKLVKSFKLCKLLCSQVLG